MNGDLPTQRHQAGFTYLIVLFAIVLVGLALATTATVWTTEARRMHERELLWVGGQFRLAIQRYYLASPGGAHTYPRKLDDLLNDSRWPEPMHHLRRIYPDPLTGLADWELVSLPDGQVVGVYSPDTRNPLKKAGFSPDESGFAEAGSYSDWRFVYLPQLTNSTYPASTPVSIPAPNR